MKENKHNTIYAHIVAPEHYDYRDYEMDVPTNVIIDGGRDFGDFDPDGELKAIKKAINEINNWSLEQYYDNKKQYLTDLLSVFTSTGRVIKDNGKELSPKEIQVLYDALWNGEDEDIAMILSIIHCKRYKHCGLRGCSQGDYADLYYPEKTTSQKVIDWIEAWYFGTGYEVEIHDGEDIPTDYDEICGYIYLTTEWSEQGIIDEIKKSHGKNTKVILWDEHGNQIEG